MILYNPLGLSYDLQAKKNEMDLGSFFSNNL